MGEVEFARTTGAAVPQSQLQQAGKAAAATLGGEAQPAEPSRESTLNLRDGIKGPGFMPHWDPCPQPRHNAEAQARELVNSVLDAQGRADQLEAFASFSLKIHSRMTSDDVVRATRDLLIDKLSNEGNGQQRRILAAMLHVVDRALEERGQIPDPMPCPHGPGPDPAPSPHWPPHIVPLQAKKEGDIF